MKRPQNLKTYDEQGEFDIYIKKKGTMFPYVYANHPFDVVGWDGHHYPYTFSIFDFEPTLPDVFICLHPYIKHSKVITL